MTEKENRRFEELYNSLVCGNITYYKERLKKMKKATIAKYIQWAEEMEINIDFLRLDFLYK